MKTTLNPAVRVASILLFSAVAAFGQQQVNLSAGPSSVALPDGTKVPMWGYSCGTIVNGSSATCSALNQAATGWSPVLITVPTGQDLTINLTNNLSFTPAGSSTPNKIPTSLVIVGQLGGGLGSSPTMVASPTHPDLQVTWSTVGSGGTFTPPAQGQRVQSFSTEVEVGSTTPLTWKAPRPGTYLIESGTHPSIQGPMGLYGILVVTTHGGGVLTSNTAYPGVSYNADVPLLLSEIDPVQNTSVNAAVNTVGFKETMVWSGQPGGCGNSSSATYQQCYPPAVNYSPLYYLFNGVAFDKTHPSTSVFSALVPANATPGTVLVRFVNAGLRMHVPSIVGALTGTPAVGGFSLIAEDGNPLPGTPRVQSEVFLAAGKTYDVMINKPATGATALPVFDRQLSLSGNATDRDAGMLAYISVNSAALPAAGALATAVANPDLYNSLVPGEMLTVSDPSKGVIANDVNVYGVKVVTPPTKGTLTLNANGTFVYVPNTGTTADSFVYQANGNGPTALVTLAPAPIEGSAGITVGSITYNSNVATHLTIPSPGVLSVAKDSAGYPLTISSVIPGPGLNLSVSPSGGFTASVSTPGTYTFTFRVQNSQGTISSASSPGTATLIFPTGSGLNVSVVDGKTLAPLTGQDYRWIIEEDRTFYVDPTKTTNTGSTIVPTFGVNFHTSNMPFVAQGCTGPKSCEAGQTVIDPKTGSHVTAVCDVGNGACRPDTAGTGQTWVSPSQVHLDPTKRYYISVLPGDAADPFYGASSVGHSMGGASITYGQTSVQVLVQATPFPPGKLSVFVFEDDFPLNGEQDAGGGVDVLAPNEPGLGGFNIQLWDAMGGNGDFTGQMTYDMFNQPLTNSLAGTKDPVTGFDACPISAQASTNAAQAGIAGTIFTCPKFESDGVTLSPLAGQAVVANLMPGRFGVVATPGADRIARGEEWLQTNTLDGQKAHDSFIRIGEPSFFQEFGPAGYHVTVGFANPAIINARKAGVCAGTDINLSVTGPCNNSVKGHISMERMSRTPDERLYGSGTWDSYYFTQCYVSFGDPDGEDFAFTKCDANGNFSLTGLPPGDWRVTVFDKWNDLLVDGLSTPVALTGGTAVDMGEIPINQWQANLYTRTFIDDNKDGVSQSQEAGIPLIPVSVRYRDGSLANNLVTDFGGNANFNETFPLFNWYTVETDVTRYKNTGTHVVYDAGGPADGTTACGQTGYPPCGNSVIGKYRANTAEQISVPANLRVPGAVYCANADCTGYSIQGGPGTSAAPSSGTSTLSTGRIDPPWVGVEGWQGFSGQNNFIEFGKTPYAVGENGGIKGHVVYASTRPFDDPQMLVQTQWEPLVPHVTINLYQEGTAPDGSQSLTLIDTTQTSSWDDWAQGVRSDGMPNMNCPGQSTADLFYFSLYNQPNYLNVYNSLHGGPAATALPYNSQYKCYDGMHNWNQIQPAPYDGMYKFPSSTGMNPQTGASTGTNCTACTTNPVDGTTMLAAGKYVVEVVMPPGFELVKEEDKNILIGDNFIAPVTQEFGALGNVFIVPDQASVASAYNANNAQNSTTGLGTKPYTENVPAFPVEPVWPCVGQSRIVPDYISLFPQSKQVSPFAGATRNLCDRKEVTLGDQTSETAKFYIFTSTHIASKFTGVITDDFTSEFDPFSPQFGEKFSPPDLPVSVKDWTGTEISRVYADHWGAYNGMTYSTWEVNPPNPTGYSPTMMIFCMNDPGTGTTPDPLFNPAYSQFCYELPYMPGQTQYLDTPVVPTSAFAGGGYNNVDCAYPAATPAISEVDGDGVGPWVSAPGKTLTITALGDQLVNNYAYTGPSATTAPFNQKTVTRHYGFGATQGTGGVTIGGVAAAVTGWSDTQITVTVPTGVKACPLQQQKIYGGPGAPGVTTASCGELVVTAGNGVQSIDTVTVTIGGKPPVPVTTTIQAAIDAAAPGDLIIVPKGVYNEMLLMWKPVRLQGVGAVSSVINANTQPAGKMDPWRQKVVCLFGLALNGVPISGTNVYDPTSTVSCGSTNGVAWNAFNGAAQNPQVDRLPLEGIVGWDTTVNGNLAQLLQEPTLLGAYEGAGITVLSKGVNTHNLPGYYGSGAEAAFPTGTTVLTAADCVANGTNPFPSNFQCNPSRIDGLSITDSSQGGGGIYVHAWGHNLEIANNRVYNNIGTLSGGINVGQGESPDAYLAGSTADSDPGSCQTSSTTNLQLPYCFDLNVNVHHNSVTLNSSIGDELFSGTPAGAGGVSFCTGADYYQFNYNWVCGNMSTGDGGGVAHIGFIWNGDIEHNTIVFNQSTNPTISTNGGGLIVMGAAPDGFTASGIECGSTAADLDCAPGLPDGTGPGLVINANLIMGNAAESGSGGGLRLQSVNGTEVSLFPQTPSIWNSVTVTNNIIANNVAGWDGGGVSLQDALVVNLINNTIISNDSTASAGPLFNTLGAPLASAPGATNQTTSATTSAPQPGGLVTMPNSSNLTATFAGLTIKCPTNNPNCTSLSYPYLANDVFWQNRSYYIGVGALSATYQQNVVSLYNSFTSTLAPSQPSADATSANGSGSIVTGGTGACTTASYWDIGVRGDTGPHDHSSKFTLAPTYSVLTDTTGYTGTGLNNMASNPTVVSQYCNGSRIPPEYASGGFQVPPGISDATVPNPIFNLTPTATVDEGNNWVNISWGPLSMTNAVNNTTLGNYALASGSPAIDAIPSSSPTFGVAPSTDFFGNPRPDPAVKNKIDIGAVEFQVPAVAVASVTPKSLTFGSTNSGSTSAAQALTLSNTGGATLTGITVVVTAPFSRPTGAAGGTCGTTLAAASTCTINVVFSPTAGGAATGTATITGSVAVTNSPVSLTGTGVATAAIASVTPASLAFGNVGTGTTSTAQALTLSNTGTGPLNTIAVVVTAPFSRPTGAAGGTCGTTLAAASTCTINVVFSPTAAGAASGTATITGSAAVTNSPVSLTGTGVATVAIANVTPTSLAFGNQATGTTSTAQALTLHNTGTGSLTTIAVAVTAPFSRPAGVAGGTCGTILAAAATCTINVVFSPTAAGAATGTATITGSVTVSGSPVSLTGTGTSAAAIANVTPTSLAFGNAITGTTSTAQAITLHNTGNAALNTIAVVVTAPFSRPTGVAGGTCGTTLAAASTCTINVVFSPTAAGGATGTATVTGSVTVSGSPVSLTGTGVAPIVAATLTPTTWSPSQTRNCPGTGLGVLACLADPTQAFTLTNTGNVPLTGVTAGSLAGTNANEYAVALSTCGSTLLGTTTLAPAATCTITVQFKPLTAQPTGVQNATISVTDLAGTQTSTLTGTAN
jgi:hypothetical protein